MLRIQLFVTESQHFQYIFVCSFQKITPLIVYAINGVFAK